MALSVCVTGASGFVATEITKQLLEKGYNVTGTVRSTTNAAKVQHLQRLGEALPGHLRLMEADLLKEGAFDSVVKGCTYVIHAASPFLIDVKDAQKDLIEPAVLGTRNVLMSAIKATDTVKRVVLTSSVAAVHGEYAAPPKNRKVYTEEDWNETSTIDNGQAYHLSKTLAEKEAWKLAKEHGLDLVTICPNFVLGPVISSRVDGLSAGFVKGLLEGNPPTGSPAICDVRDVARAHILAAEQPSASGRYIVSERSTLPPRAVATLLQKRFPKYRLPSVTSRAEAEEKMDNSKAQRELGLCFRPWQETFVDMATTLIAVGVAHPKVVA